MDLARQESDIAIRMHLDRHVAAAPNVRLRHLGAIPWALFGSPVQEGERLRVVVYDDHAPGRVGEDWVRDHASEVKVVMRTSSMYATAEAVRRGIAAGFLPTPLATSNGFRQCSDAVARSHIYVATHPDLRDNARIRVVFDNIVDFAERHPQLFG